MDRPSNRFGARTATGRGCPKGAHATVCLLLASSLGCDAVVGRMVEAAVERQVSAGHTEWLDDGALHVVLCGTGSPLPDPTSAAACTAVVAGGRVWVVDVGPGSQEVAQLIGVPRAPRSATEWTVHEVPASQGEATVIHREGGLTIKAFAVDHAPVAPAVGYRFEYGSRSGVISGDTDVSPISRYTRAAATSWCTRCS